MNGYSDVVYLYRSEGGFIDTVHPVIVDPRRMTPATRISSTVDVIGADLDGDGADELIVVNGGIVRGTVKSLQYEVWIYKGGPGFQLDTPTVIIRDNGKRSEATGLVAGRWDGDQYLDIAVSGIDYDSVGRKIGQRLKFWFGNAGSPWNWTTPDRGVVLDNQFITALDCDGDGVLDLAMPPIDSFRVRLFRSGNGKSWRTRTLAYDDIDATYYRKGYASVNRLGYLSDSLKHFEMLGIGGADGNGPTTVLGLNGGTNGPDHQYDAYEASGEEFSVDAPIQDVTGDGWNDWMIGYSERGFHAGFAAIYAGGPYIPRDSTSGVEDVAVAGVRTAISVWPNPAHDELHMAWRGDLHRMPSRFTAHDMLGRLVAEGRVEPWRGEALWNCSGRPAGVYVLSIYSDDNSLLATTRIIKQ
ncbi:MAG TPA: T9SS type A sorting domain-containing protein [Candidatus Kapabacteria bacterium]|nr:T9SS type A sorting domain-containing protein [Candidatus Kapabacteria bacterium]